MDKELAVAQRREEEEEKGDISCVDIPLGAQRRWRCLPQDHYYSTHPLSLQVESSSVLHQVEVDNSRVNFLVEIQCALSSCARVETNLVYCAHNVDNYVKCKCIGEQRAHLGGGRGECALRLHHPLATDTVALLLRSALCSVNKKLTMFAGLFLHRAVLIGHLSLLPSHDEHWCLGRASWRWTFYGFSNESHHSGKAGHEGVGLQRRMKQWESEELISAAAGD